MKAVSGPRFWMFLIVVVAAVAGFLGSVVLLHLSLRAMWLRYGIAVILAYAVFLGLLWVTVQHYVRRKRDAAQTIEFGERAADPDPPRASDHDILDMLDLPFDLPDEGVVLIAFLAAAIAVLVAFAYVIATAPSLMGEMVVDAGLGVTFYYGLKRVVGKTRSLLFYVLLFFMAAGAASHWYAPEAASIGGVVRHYQSAADTWLK